MTSSGLGIPSGLSPCAASVRNDSVIKHSVSERRREGGRVRNSEDVCVEQDGIWDEMEIKRRVQVRLTRRDMG